MPLRRGTLSPSFNAGTTSYTLTLDKDTTAATLTAAALASTSTLKVDGVAGTSKTVTLARGASQTVVFTVTAQNGDTKDYTVVVSREFDKNTALASLTASKGTLSPAFSAATTAYTLTLDKDTAAATLTAAAAESTSTLKVDGVLGTSKTVTLAQGASQQVIFTVTAENGDGRDYKVTVTRSKDDNVQLASLTSSAGTLSPAFNAATTSYNVTLDAAGDIHHAHSRAGGSKLHGES